ncbi:MAG: hypothetical protein HY908_35815 [Myxococcales bacterium]|nr:hypothetical protein [Myxococcales bacterium]
MLYRLDPQRPALGPLELARDEADDAATRAALAASFETLFRPGRLGPPVVVARRPAHPLDASSLLVGVDAEARLLLLACTSAWADRGLLEQLLDGAATYGEDPYRRLLQDWIEGGGDAEAFLPRLRALCDDPELRPEDVARDHVLVVAGPGRDGSFQKIADFLERRGVLVCFAPVRAYRAPDGGRLVEVPTVDLSRGYPTEYGGEDERSWLVVLDEPGGHRRFIERQVAAVWGHADGPAVLDQGVQPGDVVYAYELGVGVVARGIVMDHEIRCAAAEESVFPACRDGNEWQLRVEWIVVPGKQPLRHAEVRRHAGAGLPVRTPFGRLWRAEVGRVLARHWE